MLSETSVKRLRELQRAILREPLRFSMAEGICPVKLPSAKLVPGEPLPECGTALCMAGTEFIIGKRFTKAKLLELSTSFVGVSANLFTWHEVKQYAAQRLDLSHEQSARLFYIKSLHGGGLAAYVWPVNYETAYLEAKSALERAYVGAARIEHFIATGGNE